MYSLPNLLTISRIVVIPVIFLSIYIHAVWWSVFAAVLFIVAAITDYFDGYLARSRNQTSVFGRLLDQLYSGGNHYVSRGFGFRSARVSGRS